MNYFPDYENRAIFLTPPNLSKAKSVDEFNNLNFKKANKFPVIFYPFGRFSLTIILFISNASLIDTVPTETGICIPSSLLLLKFKKHKNILMSKFSQHRTSLMSSNLFSNLLFKDLENASAKFVYRMACVYPLEKAEAQRRKKMSFQNLDSTALEKNFCPTVQCIFQV